MSRLELREADRAAVNSISNLRYHILRANTDAAKAVPLNGPAPFARPAIAKSASAVARTPGIPSPGFFPSDLTFNGGAVITSAESNNVYVNCSDASCWGDPAGFLNHLGRSNFIHVADQYVGLTSDNRYPVGPAFSVSGIDTSAPLELGDIIGIVHTAAVQGGGGYGHIYHVFLPAGVDTCLSTNAGGIACYSPDDPSTFVFCAYHSNADFSDIGHVLFTVEPFQAVQGCEVAAPRPNGKVSDSTNSTLSHELFEAITDPDGNAWIALNSLAVFGDEIGDLCQGAPDPDGDLVVPTFLIGAKNYEVQLEYSNAFHGCVAGSREGRFFRPPQ